MPIPSALGSMPAARTRTALIVDDEEHVLSTLLAWLSRLGWQVVCTHSISEALRVSRDPTLTIALVDYRLTSGDDGIRLGRVLRQRRGIPFVLISGYLRPSVVVQAMKAGALDVLEKPLAESEVQGFFRGLLEQEGHDIEPQPTDVNPTDSDAIATKWSKMVLKACHSRRDPRTVSLWANSIGVSATTIDEACRLCGVRAHASRDIARFLRALALSKRRDSLLRSHFAIADKRTIDSLFQRAGVPFNSRFMGPQMFFRNQTLIDKTKPCLQELAHRCANSPLFF